MLQDQNILINSKNEVTSEAETCEIELSIVMPCLNEDSTVHLCVWKAKTFLNEHGIKGEVIISDNGSTDSSIERAKAAGAMVVCSDEKGYGAALMNGIKSSKGKYIIMADSDDSYDFLEMLPLLEQLRLGYDLVVGNRFTNKMKKGAMPWLHQYLGNPVLSFIGKTFFKSEISDFHCGLRGFSKLAYEIMNLQTTGMEFASEMIVKATLNKLKMIDVPVTLYPDGRDGKSHLKTWSDGWRHLRFLLLYSPRWLFLYPGIMLMIFGFTVTLWALPNPYQTLDIHTILFAVGAILIGFQSVFFAISTKAFAVHEKLVPRFSWLENAIDKISLELALKIGTIFLILGGIGLVYLITIWLNNYFFELGITITMRIAIFSFTFLVFGFQIIFSFFFYSYLKIQLKK